MRKIIVAIFVGILFILCACVRNGDCHPSHKTNVVFGTKTAYKIAQDFPWPTTLDGPKLSKIVGSTDRDHRCKPSQINMIFR